MGFLQIFPQLSQTYLNPELLSLMAQQRKKTLNIDEWTDMAMDAIQYAPRNPLWIDMSDEQKQAMSQPPPEAKAKMAMQQQQLAADKNKHDNQNITKLLTVVLKELLQKHTQTQQMDDDHLHELLSAQTAQLGSGEDEPGAGEGDSGQGG